MLAVAPPDLALVAERNPSLVAQAADGRPLLEADRTILVTVRSGALELWATRRPDGGVEVAQTVGTDRQPLDVAGASFTGGLPGFVRLVVRRPNGAVVVQRSVAFCPNTPFAHPVDLEGASPLHRYPFDCGHVFSRAVVWGLDRGWASPLDIRLPVLPTGRYVLDATIVPRGLQTAGTGVDRLRVPVRLRRPARGQDAARPTAERAAHAREPVRAAPRYPDLLPLPPEGFYLERTRSGRDRLRFGSNVWNAGEAPAVVVGRRGTTRGRSMPAFQVLNGRRRPAGLLVYDVRDGHLHWHFDGLARYRLLQDGGAVAAASTKVGFCFGSTDAIDLSLPRARWNPAFGGDGCASGRPGARSLRMALQVGWGDQYDQTLPGQALDVTELPNGAYELEVAVDPRRRLVQSDRTNDVVRRPIVLGGRPGARTVTVPAWDGIDAEHATSSPPGAAAARAPMAAVRRAACLLPLQATAERTRRAGFPSPQAQAPSTRARATLVSRWAG